MALNWNWSLEGLVRKVRRRRTETAAVASSYIKLGDTVQVLPKAACREFYWGQQGTVIDAYGERRLIVRLRSEMKGFHESELRVIETAVMPAGETTRPDLALLLAVVAFIACGSALALLVPVKVPSLPVHY